MQRAIPEQKLGVYFHYHDQERFHYITLTNELQLSLARRGGIKNYDRVISFNGVNVENDTYEQLYERFDNERHLPAQMLVCSPATYAHYKSNKKPFYSNLRTVQHLKPVHATSGN
jgi:C-terminal processing protease CtpA/Prc